MSSLAAVLERCEQLYEDLDLECVAAWKQAHPYGAAVGYLPVHAPREILHAAGVLPVGVTGGGDQLEIVRGDACFQSYICHLPRSVVELGLSGRLDALDGMIFPSTCDVVRNLSGIWQILFPERYCHYLDLPQNFDRDVGGRFYAEMLERLFTDMCSLTDRSRDDCDLFGSIRTFNANRAKVRELYELRAREPWRVLPSEVYLVLRAGMLLPVEEHTALVRDYLQAVQAEERHMIDNARVVVTGVFCEQPPLTLIRTLERAGCDVVDDDHMLVLRWLGSHVEEDREDADPIQALVDAFLDFGGETATRYVPDGQDKGARLIEQVRSSGAEGVVFASPSFCDPALLDRPMLQAALDRAGIAHTAFKYSENTGQMQPIREQAGTFADTIKLWEGV